MKITNHLPVYRSGVNILALFLLVTTSLLSACAPMRNQVLTPPPTPTPIPCPDVLAKGKIVVGSSLDYPPFEYYNAEFTQSGYDIALVQEIGKRLGVPVEIEDLAFDYLGTALELGEIDLAISAISITPARQAQFTFSTPYLLTTDGVLAEGDSEIANITSIEQMADKRVGVQSASVYERILREVLVDTGRMPKRFLHVYGRINDAATDLQAGKLDLVMMDISAAEEYARLYGLKLVGEGLYPQTMGIGFRQGCGYVQSQVNLILAQLDEEGFLKQLGVQYLGLEPEEVQPIPTPIPPTPTPAQPVQPTAGPPPPCTDGMAFVQDLNYPDYNMTSPPIVMPGTPFVKGWRIRNSGTCTWDSRYILTYVGGNTSLSSMGGQPTPVSGSVPPGSTFDMYVSLVAPIIPGVYQGFWELKNPSGVSFGNRIWVGITVPTLNPATPTPAPGKPSIYRFIITPSEIQVGGCVNIDWVVEGTVTYTNLLRNGSGLWLNGPASGSLNDCPPNAGVYTYTLQAFGPAGQVETSRQLNVEDLPQPTATPPPVYPPFITSFTAQPSAIDLGGCVALNWAVDGTVDTVRLYRDDQPILDNASNAGQANDCPPQSGQVTYRLQALGAGQEAQSTQIVMVASPPTQPPPPTSPPPFLNVNWALESYLNTDGQTLTPIPGTEITLVFASDNSFSGLSGCNSYNGSYQATSNQLIMTTGVVTQQACAVEIMNQESTYLVLLGLVNTYQFTGRQLLLFAQSGELILTYNMK
jgi:polar amino acid transport system substrate-binding protein